MATPLQSVQDLTPLLGEDEEYKRKLTSAREAETKLAEMLKRRTEGPRFNPAMLALAGELLDPGRTGSFGEAIGRGAKAYSAAQSAMDKDAAEVAMMRLQMERAGLDSARRSAAMRQLGGLGAPAAAATPAQSGAPAQGEAGAAPTLQIRGVDVNPTIIRNMMLIDPDIGKALETEYKLRLESIKTQPGYMVDVATGKVTPVIPPGQADVEIRFPEKGGEVLMGSTEDLIRLRQAREKGDASAIDAVYNRVKFGVRPPEATAPAAPAGATPAPAGVAAATAPPSVSGAPGAPSVQQAKIRQQAEEAAATEEAKALTKKARAFLDAKSEATATIDSADRIISYVSRSPEAFGPLAKPGVGTALATLINKGIQTQSGSIKLGGLEEAIVKANPGISQQALNDAMMAAQEYANLELRLAQTQRGLGAFSDSERELIRRGVGSIGDDPMVIMKRIMLTKKRAELERDAADAFYEYRKKTGKNLDDFERSDEYKGLKRQYDTWIRKTFNLPEPAKPTRSGSLSSSAVQEELRKRGLQ
jgi:hypothetical protein